MNSWDSDVPSPRSANHAKSLSKRSIINWSDSIVVSLHGVMLVPEIEFEPVLRLGNSLLTPRTILIFACHVASAWRRVTRKKLVMPASADAKFARRRLFAALILRGSDFWIFRFVSVDA